MPNSIFTTANLAYHTASAQHAITTNWMRAADTKVLQKMRYNIDLELKRRKDEERKNGPRFIFVVDDYYEPRAIFLRDLKKKAVKENDPNLTKAFNRILDHNELNIVTLADFVNYSKETVISSTRGLGTKLYDLAANYICKCGYAYWKEVNP